MIPFSGNERRASSLSPRYNLVGFLLSRVFLSQSRGPVSGPIVLDSLVNMQGFVAWIGSTNAIFAPPTRPYAPTGGLPIRLAARRRKA